MTPVQFMALFDEFQLASWDGWRAILGRLTAQVREFFCIVGRGAGKSRMVALLACFYASRDYTRVSGERIYIGVFAPDRKQAGVTFKYVIGLLRSVPALSALIERETRESVALSTGITIEVISARIAAPRGRAYALAIVEEAAFLPQDQDANPDVELLRALRPALARVPGSLLAVVSSPYARRGVLWNAWQRYHDQPEPDVLLVQAATLDLNPSFDKRAVDKAYEEDPASAGAEYGGLFRSDVDGFISAEAIAACVTPGVHELSFIAAPDGPDQYVGFVDPSGGSRDSFTLAIGHQVMRDEHPIAVIDCLRETRPPFSPEAVVTEYAARLTDYDIVTVTGDRYAGEWPREQFRKHGITYEPSARPKSELYRDALAMLNSGHVELLDHPRLITQLGALERRTARGGRDSIDHAPGGHDDVANVVCGVAVAVSMAPQAYGVGRVLTADRPAPVLTVDDAERELARRRALRATVGVHDEVMPLRWVAEGPIEDEPARVLSDWDPFVTEPYD